MHTRYELLTPLGTGGMGTVYRAYDRLTGHTVALKQVNLTLTLLAQTPNSSSAQLALAHEFQTLAALHHPNIISVLDYGFNSVNEPFFTMTLLQNAVTIREAAVSQPTHVKITLLIQLLQALAYLHRHGILHRDLKPANVLVEHGDQVRVLDFGLAEHITRARGISGTLAYMAPEILSGQAATPAADLFSVGVLAYELFFGKHPYHGDDLNELIFNILYSDPDPEQTFITPPTAFSPDDNLKTMELRPISPNAEVEPIISRVLERLLKKDPAERYHDAVAVIHELSAAIGQPPPETAAIRESFLQAAPFVGRTEEITRLQKALHELVGTGGAWLIGGESGVGKSRLLDEIRIRALIQGVRVLQGQAVSGQGLPYQVWRGVFRQLVLDATDHELAVLQDFIPDLERLLGRPIPPAPEMTSTERVRQLTLTVQGLFRRQATPMLLLLEDLHWSSHESLELLKAIAALTTDNPLLILATYRHDERPALPDSLPTLQVMMLGRLDHPSIATLTEKMLGTPTPEIVELLQRETEGNVFFLVEVVRALAAQAGRLEEVAHMTLPEKVFAEGIQSIVERRLSRLPEWAQPLLKLSAIAGRELDLAILHAALPSPLEDWLLACHHAVILEIRDGRWRFVHDKLRDGVLMTITPDESVQLHRQIATALEATYPHNAAYAAMLAEHWAAAGDAEKEAQYADLAGQEAQRFSNYRPAIAYFQRALAYYPPDAMTVAIAKINLQLGAIFRAVSEYPQAIEHFTIALAIAETLTDQALIASALRGWGTIDMDQGRHAQAAERFERAIAISRAIGDEDILSRTLGNLAIMKWFLGDTAGSIAAFQEAIPITRRLDSRRSLATQLGDLANIYYLVGDYAQAAAHYEEALAIAREVGDPHGAARHLGNLGLLYQRQGQIERSIEYLKQAITETEKVGDKRAVAIQLGNLGQAYRMMGDFEQALVYLQESVSGSEKVGNRYAWSTFLRSIAEIHLLMERLPQALATARQALEIANTLQHPITQYAAGATLGWALLRRGKTESAREVLHGAIQLPDTGLEIDAHLAMGVVMLGAGDDEAAQGMFETVLQRLELAMEKATDFEHGYRLAWAKLGLVMVGECTLEEVVGLFREARAAAPLAGLLQDARRLLAHFVQLERIDLEGVEAILA